MVNGDEKLNYAVEEEFIGKGSHEDQTGRLEELEKRITEEEKQVDMLIEKRKELQGKVQQLETAIQGEEIALVISERENEVSDDEENSWKSSVESSKGRTEQKGIYFMENKVQHLFSKPNRGTTERYTYGEVYKGESCYNCGERGHIALFRQYKKICYRCSGRGHMAKECRGDRMESQYSKEIQRGRKPSGGGEQDTGGRKMSAS